MLFPCKDQIKKLLDDRTSKGDVHRVLEKETSELEHKKMHDFIEKHFKSKDEKEHMILPCKDRIKKLLDYGTSKGDIHRMLEK